MGSKVQEQIAAPPTDLELAGQANDRFVATLGELAAKTLADICKTGEDERARVTAAKELLNWIRPPKAATIALNVAPTYHSHLNLPAPIEAPPAAIELNALDSSVPKLLPESRGRMSDSKLTAYSEVTMKAAPAAPTLPAREQKPRVPEMPPLASTVRRY